MPVENTPTLAYQRGWFPIASNQQTEEEKATVKILVVRMITRVIERNTTRPSEMALPAAALRTTENAWANVMTLNPKPLNLKP